MTRPRIVVAVASAAVATLALAACGGGSSGSGTSSSSSSSSSGATGYNAAITGVVNPSTATGGTLQYVHPDDWDSPDPGNTYYAFSWDFSRLYARTLMTFKPAPGDAGLQIVPDLAQGPGVSTDGAKTWTYKLKSGLKFQDGTPITSKDIKYAVERSNYAPDVLSNGPTYFNELLGTNYPGPYKDTSPDKMGLTAITTPDDQTIVFHLQKPFAEFDYLATFSQTAPVPPSKDTGAKYLTSIVSSGPYKIDSYEPGKEMTLSKNANWDPATDPIRKQLADKIVVTLKVDANDIDNRLLAGDADIAIDGTGVQQAAKIKILNDPKLKANTDDPVTGFLRYVAINTTIAPFDNVDCRKAVLYAADHSALQTAYGGPTSGDIATTTLPPNIVGYEKADTYGFLANPNGDVAKAKDALAKCGKPNGFSTVITARANRPKEVAGATALQQALAKVGITAQIQTYPSGQYFSNFAGSTAFVKQHNIGLMFMGWGADWPSGYGFLQQILAGSAIKASGNSNLSQLNDPAINKLFDDSLTMTDTTARKAVWTQIDQKVMADAAILPIVYDKALDYRNPEVSNVYIQPAYGMYDYVAMGIHKQ
jgi:peptide/nickel transport system substrate-binding protein